MAASFADIDNDGDQDLFVTTVRGGNVLFENDGKGHFRDISKEAGVDYVGHSSGAVFFDYDNDGLLDLFLCNVGQLHDRRARAGAARTSGYRTRSPATSIRTASETSHPLQEPRRQPVQGRHRTTSASATPAGAATRASPI